MILLATLSSASAQDKTIFSPSDTPSQSYNGGPVELGVRFRSDVAGSVKGIRFYKTPGDNTAHTGSLWTNNGQLLATGTFSGETASGWQTLTFASPVAIAANTTYIASYHTGGAFSYTWYTFQNQGVDNAPLHALKDGLDGGNGLYLYGPGGAVPTNAYASSNYWVDVVFTPQASLPLQAIAVVSGTPQSTVHGTAFGLPLKAKVTDTGNNPVSGVTVTFTAPGSGASATFNGNVSATAVTDASGIATSPIPLANATDGTYNVSASVPGLTSVNFALTNTPAGGGGGGDKSIFNVSDTPAASYNGGPVELGLRFRSDVAGLIKGVRFYKTAGDNTVHTGSLWTNNGQLLATGTFSNETASGWQSLLFNAPVAISANTTYVVSYHTGGAFSYTWYTFQNQGVDNAPLHALKDGLDGPNGVYTYGPGGSMPTSSYASSNYWVDPIFTTGAASPAITALSGTPQSTTHGTAFALPLKAKVTDGSSNPVAGVAVTFTAPGSGASATFNGSTTAVAVTDASGIATSPVPVANGTDGTYSVAATAPGYTAASFSLTNTAPAGGGGDKTIFAGNETPAASYNGGPVELGVRFRSDVAGNIKGIRFYKTAGDNTAHTGSLWTNNGQLLATGTFSGETASGWQQLNFNTPVAIQANTTYIASYHTSGAFSYTWYTFQNAGVDNAPLHALKDGVDGGNGLYSYGAGGSAPSSSYASSNYFVDVVFSSGAGGSPSIAALSGTPQTASTGAAFGAALKAKVTDGNGNPVSGITVTFTAPASGASATFNGNATTTAVTDASGVATSAVPSANAVAGTYSVTASAPGYGSTNFSLTNTASGGGPDKTIFQPTDAPTQSYNGGPVELGVRFRSDVAGTIKGIRFYKPAGDNTVHTGSLWTNNGQLLATGTFSNETASGWQTLTFSQPVAISANTTYVASYHTGGAFNYTWYTFQNQGVDNAPLHALKDGLDGPNGVYTYGPGGTMPTSSYASSNYWVDVVFSGGAAGTVASLTVSSGSPQSVAINTAFAPLKVLAKDSNGNPVSGATINFSAPAGGATGTFQGGSSAVTDASGIATAPVFTANCTVGGPYNVTATAAGTSATTSFSLNNLAGQPAAVAVVSGSNQTVTTNTQFPTPLTAKVTDACGNPLRAVQVFFAAPASGAGARFTNGTAIETATTDSAGIAVSSALTSNGTQGAYVVTAAVDGVAQKANFNLANSGGCLNCGHFTVTNATIGKNLQDSITITLNPVAPAGLPVTIRSLDKTKVLVGNGVETLTQNLFAGTGSLGTIVQALSDSGTVQVEISAPGYDTVVSTITLAPSGFVIAGPNGIGAPFDAFQGSITPLTVYAARLTAQGIFAQTQQIRAGFNNLADNTSGQFSVRVPVNLNIPSLGNLSASSVTIPGGANSATLNFTATSQNTGAVDIIADSAGATQICDAVYLNAGKVCPAPGFTTPTTGNKVTATVKQTSLVPFTATVGKNLMKAVRISLANGAPAPGPVVLTITSTEPNKVKFSKNTTDLGTASINVTIPTNFSNSPDFYVQGFDSGGAVAYTVTATLNGNSFGSTNGTVNLAPSGLAIESPAGFGASQFTVQKGGPNANIAVYVGVVINGTFVESQLVAPGNLVPVTVTSSNTNVGTITTSPINIVAGTDNASTQFQALDNGNTVITASSVGYGQAQVTAGVTTQAVFLGFPLLIGRNLQSPASVSLPALAGPGGVAVTITSNSPLIKLSNTATGVGSSQIIVTVPQGSAFGDFYVQSFGDSGTGTYTATTAQYASKTNTVNMVPSSILIYPDTVSGPVNGSTNVSVFPVALTPDGYQQQPLAGGAAVNVPVQSSNQAVAGVPAQVTIDPASTGTALTIQFKAPGNATVSITQPANFTTPPQYTATSVTVNP